LSPYVFLALFPLVERFRRIEGEVTVQILERLMADVCGGSRHSDAQQNDESDEVFHGLIFLFYQAVSRNLCRCQTDFP
jgi:hypothetical protein